MAVSIKNVRIVQNGNLGGSKLNEMVLGGSLVDYVTVGEQVTVIVTAEENTWDTLKTEFQSWGEVRRSFASWTKVKDFIYSIPNPTPDTNAVYSSDEFALFDVDAQQISVVGGATLTHTAEEVEQFVKEVKNE